MVSVLLAVLVVVTFAGVIKWLRLGAHARKTMAHTAECVAILRDPTLDDETKGRSLQRQALHLFGLCAILTGGVLVAILLPVLGVWVLDFAGVASLDDVLSILERVDFLVATLVVGLAVYLALRTVGGA